MSTKFCRNILFLFLFLGSGIGTKAQIFDRSFLFLNLKRSIPCNFVNMEFQIGSSENMDFITFQSGINMSSYNSSSFTPYSLYNIYTTSLDEYKNYESKKFGYQFALGYSHYFQSTENLKEIIPYFSLEAFWYRTKDDYTLNFENSLSGNRTTLSNSHFFHTLSMESSIGVVYGTKKIFWRGAIVFNFLLPINTTFYMPTDKYNTRSSYKLPMAGFEPALQLSCGFKLF